MGSMNVGKVSFGNTPVAGTTPGAAQQAPVKKADKGDVVVIGGKEFTKKQVAIGGGVLATAAAAITAAVVAAKRGKVVNPEGTKLFDNIRTGFKSFYDKTVKADYQKAKEALKNAADNGAKGAEAASEKGKEAVEEAANKGQAATEQTVNNGTAAQEGAQKVEGQAVAETPAPQTTEAPAADAGKKVTGEAGKGVKKAKSQELEQKAQNLQAKLDEQAKKLADLKAEQATLQKRTTDLPGVIQKQKDEAELAQMAFDEAKTNGASKKELGKLKQTLKTEKQKLAELEADQKEVATRKKVVDGQIKGLEGEKAVKGRKDMADSIAEIKKQAVIAKKEEFLANSEDLAKLNENLAKLKEKRAGLTGTDEAAVKKQGQYDSIIKKKEEQIESYKQKLDELFDTQTQLEAAQAELADLQKQTSTPEIEAKIKTLKDTILGSETTRVIDEYGIDYTTNKRGSYVKSGTREITERQGGLKDKIAKLQKEIEKLVK